MKTEHKVYAAVAILIVFAAAFWLSREREKKEDLAHAPTASSADMPSIALPKDDVDKITKFSIKNADKSNVTLEKKGDAWELTAPVSAKADQSNVKSLLDSLKELKLKESIAKSADLYPQYELTDEKGVHVTAYKGADKAIDLYFGKSGSRPGRAHRRQRRRVCRERLFELPLHTRRQELARAHDRKVRGRQRHRRDHREQERQLQLLEERRQVVGFRHALRQRRQAQEGSRKDVGQVRSRKGEGHAPRVQGAECRRLRDDKSDTGFADAAKEGGIVKIKLKDNAPELVFKIGKVSKGSSRYLQKEGSDIVYTISSWSGDWGHGRAIQVREGDKKDDKKEAPTPPPMEDEPE